MTLQLRQGKISGEMFVCDLDSMTCKGGRMNFPIPEGAVLDELTPEQEQSIELDRR